VSDDLSTAVQQARDWDYARARSQQKDAGWSDLAGGCRAYLGFVYQGAWATDDTDNWAAIKGTAMHAWYTEVRREACAAEGLDMAFDGDPDSVVSFMGIPGHVDEINYTHGKIRDYKFPALKSARYWSDPKVLDEKFTQLHGYGAAVIGTQRWHDAARRAGRDAQKATVELLVAPVDGVFGDWMLFGRELDVSAARQAVATYEVVKEQVARGEPLPKDKETFFCRRWCEFATACRGPVRDGEASELEEVLDEEHAAALEAYGLAMEAETAAAAAKKEAAELIRGVNGTARGWKGKMGNPGKPKQVPDMARIVEDYKNSGVELPMTWEDGSAPRLSVSRVTQDKAAATRKRRSTGSADPAAP
jgi:hypothetical protein